VELDHEIDTFIVDSTGPVAEDLQQQQQRIIARHIAALAEHQRTLAEIERSVSSFSG
jgi:hypothetical protein